VTITATIPQRSGIPEGLINYPVLTGEEHDWTSETLWSWYWKKY